MHGRCKCTRLTLYLHDTPQGLSRFASDIIIRGFDTPCKLGFYDGKFVCENLNYAGVVTRVLQPILPVFFAIQARDTLSYTQYGRFTTA